MNFTFEDLKALVAEQAINNYLLARENAALRNQMAAMQSAFEEKPTPLTRNLLREEMEDPE